MSQDNDELRGDLSPTFDRRQFGAGALGLAATAAGAAEAATLKLKDQVKITSISAGLDPSLEFPTLPAPQGVAGYGENDGFWVWDDDRKVGMHLWLGTHMDYSLKMGRVTIWLPDGRILANIQLGPGTTSSEYSNGVLTCRAIEPYQVWAWKLFGATQVTTAAELKAGPLADGPKVLTKVEATATMATPPWQQGGFYDREEWLKTRAASLHGGWRFEQLLRAEGVVQVGDEPPIRFSGFGNRTHRKGARKIGGLLPGHTWIHTYFPSGKAFYVKWFGGADGRAVQQECYIKQGDNYYNATISDPPLMRAALAGEPIEIAFTSKLGVTRITGELAATSFQTLLVQTSGGGETWGIDYRRKPDDLAMDQGFIRFRWDGETACGMVERSLPIASMPQGRS